MAQHRGTKEPTEDTCLEFLKDNQGEVDATGIVSLTNPSNQHDYETFFDDKTQQLAEKIRALEKVEEITQQDIETLRAQTDTLEKEMRVVKETCVSAKSIQEQAEAAAVAMKQQKDQTNKEKDVMKNRLQQLAIAQKKDNQNRAMMANSYDKNVRELREVCNTQNSKLMMMESRLRELEDENCKLKEKNNFLEVTLFVRRTDDADDTDQQLKCFSCKGRYSAESVMESECKFHPLPGIPPNSWHRWRPGPGETFRRTKYAGYFYWPCCNTLSLKRPDGCCISKHHQKWEMDVVMKQVMLSRETLDKMSRMESTRII